MNYGGREVIYISSDDEDATAPVKTQPQELKYGRLYLGLGQNPICPGFPC
jgi:hypothetical protein